MIDEQEEEKLIDIRCSSLTGYADCGLKTAVSLFWSEFVALGYQPRVLPMHVGAGVGTGTHKGIAQALGQKASGVTVNLADAVECGIAGFDDEVKKKSLTPDDVTPDKNSAHKQIGKLINGYYQTIGYKSSPVHFENRQVIKIGGGYSFSGTLDQIVRNNTTDLLDVKTGKTKGFHSDQVGGYYLICKQYGINPDTLSDIFLRRKPADQDIDRPIQTFYAIPESVRGAKARIKQIKRDHQLFVATRDPMSFPANPKSFLCSGNTCAAYGTGICPYWKLKEPNFSY